MATPNEPIDTKLSWRRYEEGDDQWKALTELIFVQDSPLTRGVRPMSTRPRTLSGELPLGRRYPWLARHRAPAGIAAGRH